MEKIHHDTLKKFLSSKSIVNIQSDQTYPIKEEQDWLIKNGYLDFIKEGFIGHIQISEKGIDYLLEHKDIK